MIRLSLLPFHYVDMCDMMPSLWRARTFPR